MDDGVTSDGEFLIDPDGQYGEDPFTAYCQFETSSGIAWTLLTSWRRDRDYLFNTQTFDASHAIEQNIPAKRNDAYRLSKTRMQSLKAESTMTRTGCNLAKDPNQDFAIWKNNDFDILSFSGGGVCKKMMKVRPSSHSRRSPAPAFTTTRVLLFYYL
jgi:hypothetical protein